MRHRLVLTIVDVSLIAFASVAAQLLRDNFETRAEQLLALAPYLGITLGVAVVAVSALRLNQSIWRSSAMADYLRVVGAAMLIALAAVVFGFLFNRLDGVARSLPIIQGFLIAAALVGARVLSRLRHVARRNQMQPLQIATASGPHVALTQEAILLVGLNAITELYLRSLAEFAKGRIAVAGVLAGGERQTGRFFHGHEVVGTPEDIARILDDLAVHGIIINRIVITVPLASLSARARSAMLEIERSRDIKLDNFAENIGIVGRLTDDSAADDAPSPATSNGTDAANFAIDPAVLAALLRRPYWRIKRALDVIGAAVGLILAAPLFVLVALVVAADAGLPLVFWQYRPGLGGRPFRLLKFRTMRPAHTSDGRRIPDAERLSGIGCLLRRCRLDELPQLCNVLVGTMSLVGPRPLLPIDQSGAMPERLAVRPGLTGWAQVMGGRDVNAADKAILDLWYICNASLRTDLVIFMGTVRMIVFGERADAAAIRRAWREVEGLRLDNDAPPERGGLDGALILPWKRMMGRYGGSAYAQRSRGFQTSKPFRDSA